MPRYFYGTIIDEEMFKVAGEEAHHLTHVMRKTVGDSILINDGKGHFYNGIITESTNDAIAGKITAIIEADVEPMTRIILCQALPKGDKMEDIIRKGTEIGIAEFLPFISKRSISHPDDHGMGRRLERWKRIAEEAAKQAGRAIVPEVHPIGSWSEVLELAKQVQTFVAWEGERSQGLKRAFDGKKKDPVAFIVGPEGGLDPSEIKKAEEYGVQSVSLGPRILRTETAGPVLAALALYARDEMDPIKG